MTTEELLESYKLSAITIKKSGYATEQNPLPILDPITCKGYEVELGKTYLMPSYMETVLGDAFRPNYESQTDANGNLVQFKVREHIPLNISAKPLTVPKEKFLESNPSVTLLFSVDAKTIDALKTKIKGESPVASKKTEAPKKGAKVAEESLVESTTFE